MDTGGQNLKLKDMAKNCYTAVQNARLDTDKYNAILDAVIGAVKEGGDERDMVWANFILGEPGVQEVWDNIRGDREVLTADCAAYLIRYLIDQNERLEDKANEIHRTV